MKRVVIDVDGVLLDLHKALEDSLVRNGYSFRMDRVLTYDFNKSLSEDKIPNWLKQTSEGYPYYLNAPRDEIFARFGKVELFENAYIYEDAIEEIKKLAEISYVKVIIATQSFTDEVAKIKKQRLLSKIGNTAVDYVDFIGNTKGIIEGADFVIEDSISNLDMYDCVKILISKTFNSPKYNSSKNNFNDIRVEGSTSSAIRYVRGCLLEE